MWKSIKFKENYYPVFFGFDPEQDILIAFPPSACELKEAYQKNMTKKGYELKSDKNSILVFYNVEDGEE